MSFAKSDPYPFADNKMDLRQIISHSDDDTASSSSEDDLKDLIETLGSYELSATPREQKWRTSKSAEVGENMSDDTSLYETANSATPSRSPLTSCSPITIKSSDCDLLGSEGTQDSSLDDSSSRSEHLLRGQRSFNTCLDQALHQHSSSAHESLCKCESGDLCDVPSLRERSFVVGIPETTIDDGVTRIIPMKFTVNEDSSYSLPRQLFHQMSSSEQGSSLSEERTKLPSANESNKVLWELQCTNSLSSIDSSSDNEEVLLSEPKRGADPRPCALELNSSSPDLKSTSSEDSSDKAAARTRSSSLSFNSELEEERLARKSEYEKILEYLNLDSSDDSESSATRSEALASAVQRSVMCSFASGSPRRPNRDPSGPHCKKERRKIFDANSSHTQDAASSLNPSMNESSKQEFLVSDDSLKDVLIPEDRLSDEESFDASALLDLHDKECIQRSPCDFNFEDFDAKELDSMLGDGLDDPAKHLAPAPPEAAEAENQKKFKHHSERPNLVDTIDKILRLGSDDVALNRLKSACKTGAPVQSIDGTVIDKELQPFAVDFTKPRAADEDTFYWVPCDFKDYLHVSDRPLVSDYFPKDSVSAQFCCVMVREFVHVHFYLRLNERSQAAYAKYNIVIWDKSRQPVAHFRSHAPVFFQAGHAHHVATFSDQAMQELLAQEMLVVSCHVTSFAKWEAGREKTPWFFSNGVAGRLKPKDDMLPLLCSHEYADVTLESSDGQKFPAHRAVICRESQLLKESVDSSGSRFVRLNLCGRLLKQMLHVFYTGELPPPEAKDASVQLPRWQEVCELAVAAERYRAERLGRKSQAWLGISLTEENVCTIYALAVRLGLLPLTHACRSYITKHRANVVNSAEWLTLKDSPAAVADLLLNTDIYDRHGGTQHLQLHAGDDLHNLSDFTIAPNSFDKKVTFKDILYEFGYTPSP